MRNTIIFTPISDATFASVPDLSAYAFDLYVSPNGSDNQAGALTAQVKTHDTVQKLAKTQAGKEPVTIIQQDGIYHLDQPPVFTTMDSSTTGASEIYLAEPSLPTGGSLKLGVSRDHKQIMIQLTP